MQAIEEKNCGRRTNSRAEFIRFLKVNRAGWHDTDITGVTRSPNRSFGNEERVRTEVSLLDRSRTST